MPFSPDLWQFIIESLKASRPLRVGLLTTASRLCPGKIDLDSLVRQHQSLSKTLPLEFIHLDEIRFGQGEYDNDIDLLCITCGNTYGARAEIWQKYHCETVIPRYYKESMPIAGYSAGFILFFEWASTDSVPGPEGAYGVMEGLGILKGGAIPHADTQAARIPDFQKILQNQPAISPAIKPVLALGENVLAHFKNEQLETLASPLAEPVAGFVTAQDFKKAPVKRL